MKNLTRDELIKRVGEPYVTKLEGVNCDFTNKVLPYDSDWVEFSAALEIDDSIVIKAFYYQTKDDIANEELELDYLNWDIDHYEIIER